MRVDMRIRTPLQTMIKCVLLIMKSSYKTKNGTLWRDIRDNVIIRKGCLSFCANILSTCTPTKQMNCRFFS